MDNESVRSLKNSRNVIEFLVHGFFVPFGLYGSTGVSYTGGAVIFREPKCRMMFLVFVCGISSVKSNEMQE